MARLGNALATLVLFIIFLKLGTLGRVIGKLELDQPELLTGMLLATLGSLVSLRLVPLKSTEQDSLVLGLGVNLGGAIVPLFFLLYFYLHQPFLILHLLLLTAAVVAFVFPLTRTDKKHGLIIYLFGAVAVAATGSVMLAEQSYLTLAYASAVLGTLIGGDLLHLTDIRKLMQTSQRSVFIGGGGVMDAIFLSGLLAMLVAETLYSMQLFQRF